MKKEEGEREKSGDESETLSHVEPPLFCCVIRFNQKYFTESRLVLQSIVCRRIDFPQKGAGKIAQCDALSLLKWEADQAQRNNEWRYDL